MSAVAKRLELPMGPTWDEQVEAARTLYCELLDGLEIAPETRVDAKSTVCFVIGCVLIETGHARLSDLARVVVQVDDPGAVASRCWNAGYTVVVDDSGSRSTASTIAVLDPFGLRIELEHPSHRAIVTRNS